MENVKIALLIITGALTTIGACLPWWTVVDLFFGTEVTTNFNPIFGHIYIPATSLSIVVGILALLGGVLLFGALKARNIGTIGGLVAIVGVLLFLAVFYLDEISASVGVGPLDLFDQHMIGFHDLTTFLGYGWYLTLVGAVGGVIASRMLQHDVA